MKILKFIRDLIDPYHNYTPSPTMPPLNFGATQAKPTTTAPKKDLVIIPHGFTEHLTSVGVKLQKTEPTKDGIEVELMDLKDAKLQQCELDAVLERYPALNKNAVIISKRCWSKGLTVPQTIVELNKNSCSYSHTYIRFFRKVFDEFQTRIGEGAKVVPLPLTPYSKNANN